MRVQHSRGVHPALVAFVLLRGYDRGDEPTHPGVRESITRRRDRLLTWLLPTAPLVLFSTGLACYLGSLAIRLWGLARYEAILDLRIALEGLSALLLAVGVLWGIVAAFWTRTPVAFAGLARIRGLPRLPACEEVAQKHRRIRGPRGSSTLVRSSGLPSHSRSRRARRSCGVAQANTAVNTASMRAGSSLIARSFLSCSVPS